MGRIHKLMLRSCFKGVLVGWTVLACLIYFNAIGLRDLIFSSSDGILAAFLLMVGFGITFGNAAMGHAIMTVRKKDL